MKPFLQAALAAAEAAAEDIMHYYRGNFEVELKPDQTPVTVADRRAEEIINSEIASWHSIDHTNREETHVSSNDSKHS